MTAAEMQPKIFKLEKVECALYMYCLRPIGKNKGEI